MNNNLDKIRENTLREIEKNERNFKLMLLGFAIFEMIFFVLFFLLADFSNRTHILLFIATISSYSIIMFCLGALGMHINRSTLRILQAIQLEKSDE